MQRAQHACMYTRLLEDDIRGNFIIIYYFFNHNTALSFCVLMEEHFKATHSALEISKALFAAAARRRDSCGARIMVCCFSELSEAENQNVYVNERAHGCEKCAQTRGGVRAR
jgi:hypothetical protein